MVRALIVDDASTIRMMLSDILRQFGYAVEQAKSGEDALAKIAAWGRPAELILLDWNMPGMSGLDVVKELRKQSALNKTVIVMVTGDTELERVVEALQAGADEYIMKPFSAAILRDKLHLLGLEPEAYEEA